MSSEAATLSDFIAGWDLFALPVLAGGVAGALLGCLGVYVVLRRLVFLSAAVSQAAGFGVALAFYAQLHLGLPAVIASPTAGATLVTLLVVLLVATERAQASARRDALLGLGYLIGAAGALILGTRIAQELHDVQSILFGSAVAVLPDDFTLLVSVAVGVLVLHLWWWRGFAAAAFDPDGARVRRLPVPLLEAAFFVTLALAVSVCTRVLGALPTFAFSVLPAMAAVRLAGSVPSALRLAALFGAGCGVVGYIVAFLYQLPVGAAQTAVGVLLVALAELARRALRPLQRA